jgi:hypothetical protein
MFACEFEIMGIACDTHPTIDFACTFVYATEFSSHRSPVSRSPVPRSPVARSPKPKSPIMWERRPRMVEGRSIRLREMLSDLNWFDLEFEDERTA